MNPTRQKLIPTLAGLLLACSALAADPAVNTKLTVAQPVKTGATPQLIVRKPITLQATGAPTNRLMSKASLAQLIDRGLTAPTLKPTVNPTTKPTTPARPGKLALLVILENGGVMNNVDPALRSALNKNIVTVTCEGLEFELPQGKTIVDLIADVGSQIGNSLNCLNPNNWRRTTFNPLTWLNEQTDFVLEAAITGHNSLANTQTQYDRVVVMEDADAVPARVLATIRQLAPEYVLDIHVLTHGTDELFVGHNGALFADPTFFSVLANEKKAGTLPLYLRAVYQMNCRGGTLKDNWRALGAITVNGTVGSNLNNMPHQYFHFMQKWLGGTGMSDAANAAFNEAAAYSRPIYSLVGKGALIDVSRLPAEGSRANANVNASL